jgi:hypothetical protein
MKHARQDYQEKIQAPEDMIPADEPVFLLRAQDIHAAATVRYWANRVYAAGGSMDVIQAAHQIAEEMDDWPTKKAPDLP